MGWSFPDISLEDLTGLVKGFVDITILASGYQSSGLPAMWDAENIKKAIRWGIFFEDLFGRLCNSNDYQDSVEEFDLVLLELKASPYFPQGLANLSSRTFTKAKDFILRHLLQTLPLRDSHLSALLTAAIEVDLDELRKARLDPLEAYIDKLMHQMTSVNLISGKHNVADTSMPSSPMIDLMSKNHPMNYNVSDPLGEGYINDPRVPLLGSTYSNEEYSHSRFIIQELLQRQTALQHVYSAEKFSSLLLEILNRKAEAGISSNTLNEQLCPQVNKEKLIGAVLCNKWRMQNLSYMLEKKTIKSVSGARLIFSVPKAQWHRVLESLKASNEAKDDALHEIIELSLLGIISHRWDSVVEHFMSVPYGISSLSKEYNDLCNLVGDRSDLLQSNRQADNPKEHDILEYVTTMVASQPHQLWKLIPILLAAAIPSRSTLFRLYLNEIGKQLKGDSSITRCCTCTQAGNEHEDCEISERIWCLHAFHIKSSPQPVDRSRC